MRGRQKIIYILFLVCVLPLVGGTLKSYRIRKVGKSPNFIALSPDGRKLYATSFGSDELLEIDLEQKGVTQSVVVGKPLWDLQLPIKAKRR